VSLKFKIPHTSLKSKLQNSLIIHMQQWKLME